jgi:hypothetical protein
LALALTLSATIAQGHGAWLVNGEAQFESGASTLLQNNVDAGLGGFQNNDVFEVTSGFRSL